jgi:hypothetical protein
MSNMNLNIVSTFKGDGIKQATGQLGAFGSQMGSFGSLIGKVGGALAAFGVTAKAIEFSRESITAARDLERNLYGVDTIFGSLAPQMRQFTENAEEMGLSQSKAAKATTFIGSVLKQSGFAMSDVAVETQKLVGLATDLSALYGYDVQEALLGMTALFRGEYDPIEKFGVAMKQNEINSELAARGQANLEGAARRNAEQTIRLELLYQRASDATGTFAAQSGSLYTEQKKLGATFENFQATLGGAVIPQIAELNEIFREILVDITPGMQQAFGFLAEVLTGVLSLIKQAMDPNTELGESVAALGIQFESLFKTIFGQDISIADFFNAAAAAAGMFFDFLHDIMRIVENLIIGFQVMGEQIGLLLSGQFQEWLEFDAAGEIRKRIDLKDTINENKLAVKQYISEWDKARELQLSGHISQIGMTADAWERAAESKNNYMRPQGLAGSADSMERQLTRITSVAQQTSAAVASALNPSSKAQTEAQREAERAQKEAEREAERAQKEAQREAERSAKEAARELAEAQKEEARLIQEAQDRAAKEEADRLKAREDAYKAFTNAVQNTFSSLKESIMSAFNLPELGNSVNSITRNIKKLLANTRSFSANITKLGQLGLNADLLDQVIQAGPVAGARLAQSLVSGGAGFVGNINRDYGEFEGLASSIAGVGTRNRYRDAQTVNNFSVNVTGGVATSADVGRAVVNAIRDFERQSGAAWRA